MSPTSTTPPTPSNSLPRSCTHIVRTCAESHRSPAQVLFLAPYAVLPPLMIPSGSTGGAPLPGCSTRWRGENRQAWHPVRGARSIGIGDQRSGDRCVAPPPSYPSTPCGSPSRHSRPGDPQGVESKCLCLYIGLRHYVSRPMPMERASFRMPVCWWFGALCRASDSSDNIACLLPCSPPPRQPANSNIGIREN